LKKDLQRNCSYIRHHLLEKVKKNENNRDLQNIRKKRGNITKKGTAKGGTQGEEGKSKRLKPKGNRKRF